MSKAQTKLSNNKYSTKESGSDGSFFHNIPIYNIPKNFVHDGTSTKNTYSLIGYKEMKIDILSEDEKMENWRRVLPKNLIRNKTIVKNGDNVNVKKRIKTVAIMKINLTQLPNYLFKRLKPIYKLFDSKNKSQLSKISHYYVRDNIYKYIVVPSDVDSCIFELKKIIEFKKYDKERLSLLLEIIGSSNIQKGWIYKKGIKMLKKKKLK